ncbi:hypothetical protein Tco_1231361 [Tanacetum coccineum]
MDRATDTTADIEGVQRHWGTTALSTIISENSNSLLFLVSGFLGGGLCYAGYRCPQLSKRGWALSYPVANSAGQKFDTEYVVIARMDRAADTTADIKGVEKHWGTTALSPIISENSK